MANRIENLTRYVGIDDHLTVVKIRYALEIIRNEAVKLIILGVLFAVLGSGMEYIFSMVLLLPLRMFSGGMHMKTNIGCFIYSLVFCMLTIILLPMAPINQAVLFSLFAVSIAVMAMLSPVASYKRPIKTEARRFTLQKKAWICLSIESVVLIIIWHLGLQEYFVIGVWVVTLQALQLFTTWIFRKLKGEKNVTKNEEMEAMACRGGGD